MSETPPGFLSGTVDMTPVAATPLAGYGERTAPFERIGSALEANWIAWANPGGRIALLIALDTLFSSRILEDAIRERLQGRGVAVETLAVVASHTHYAPSLVVEGLPVAPCDTAYLDHVVAVLTAGIARAVKTADAPPPLSAMAYGEADCAGSTYRRARRIRVTPGRFPFLRRSIQIAPNPAVDIPRRMRIWLLQSEGAAVAAIVSWPCHPTGRHDPLAVSADYIAPLRREIRELCGAGLPVVFFPGVCGDIRPDFSDTGKGRRRLYPYPFQRTFRRPTRGEEETFDSGVRLAARTALRSPESRSVEDGSLRVNTRSLPVSRFMKGGDDQPDKALALSSLTVGYLNIVAFSAEPSCFWPAALGLDDTGSGRLVTGYVGQCYGYLPTDAQIPLGGYEVSGFRKAFGLSAHYDTSIGVAPALSAELSVLRSHDAFERPVR